MKPKLSPRYFVFIGRIALFLILLYFPQQTLHEIGHLIPYYIFGGIPIDYTFSFKSAHRIYLHDPYWVYNAIFRFSGGLFAFVVLLLFTRIMKNYWVELRVISLMYSILNLFYAIIEGSFYTILVKDLSI